MEYDSFDKAWKGLKNINKTIEGLIGLNISEEVEKQKNEISLNKILNKITETDFSNLLIHGFHPKETLKNVKSLANNHPKFRKAYVILVKNLLDSVEDAVKDLKIKLWRNT